MLSFYYCLQQVNKNLWTTHDLYGISVPIYRYKSVKYHRLDIVKNTKIGIQFSRKLTLRDMFIFYTPPKFNYIYINDIRHSNKTRV